MVRSRLNDVVEYLRGTENHYLIFTSAGGAQAFLPDSPEWFTWLETLTSFHFKGKCGHFTARCERKRQGAYWYAYLKAHKRQHKQYLGMTVFVNDIGGQFLIRIGARDSVERVTATHIWEPCDNEKGSHLAFC